MAEAARHPALRIASLLGAVAVIGALIGFGADQITDGRSPAPPEPISSRAAAPAPEAPRPLFSGLSSEQAEEVRRATDDLPPYKDAMPVPLAQDYLGPRNPIAAAWFSTRDTPGQVLDYYRDTFLDAGIPAIWDRTSETSGYVGFVNPETRDVHLISVIGEGKHTLVFPSVANVTALLTGNSQVPPDLPHPPDAVDTFVMSLRNEGSVGSSVSALVPGTSLDRVVGFYRKAFTTRPWTLGSVSKQGGATILRAENTGAHATVFLQPTTSGGVSIYVHYVRRS